MTSDQIFLLAIILCLIAFLLVLWTLYKNVKKIDTPSNILSEIDELSKKLDQNQKQTKVLSSALYKTESLLLKSLNDGLMDQSASYISQAEREVQTLDAGMQSVGKAISSINEQLNRIDGQITSIRDYAGNQQQQLHRFQEGYDWEITKKFVSGLIRILDNIEDQRANLEDSSTDEILEDVYDRILIFLESNGVETFSPSQGELFKQYSNICKATQVLTSEQEKEGKVESVRRHAYIYRGPDNSEILVRAAEINVYKITNILTEGENK